MLRERVQESTAVELALDDPQESDPNAFFRHPFFWTEMRPKRKDEIAREYSKLEINFF